MSDMDLLVGAEGAARFTGLSARAIYHLVETRQLPAIRKGRRLFFRKSELEQAFQSDALTVQPAGQP